jgi:uncharacterized repeat protein (TIGR04138 family)
MEKIDFLEKIENIIAQDRRYKLEAYNFVLQALNYTVKKFNKPRHLTGRELLAGIKEYAPEQFGPMVCSVFDYWGVNSTEDFGNIVFNLVDVKLLSKTEEDSINDFRDGYDFKQAFG